MTAEIERGITGAKPNGPAPAIGRTKRVHPVHDRFRRLSRHLWARASSSLVRRIVMLNLAGLVALLAGFLYLNQFREGLIDARVFGCRRRAAATSPLRARELLM